MIVTKLFNYNSSKYTDDEYEGILVEIDKDLNKLFLLAQGRVRFGGGTTGNKGENIDGQFLTITTDAVANTETTFTHTMGSVPIGYLVLGQDKAGSLYQLSSTGTAWTSTTISLKCSVASVTFKLFLLQ
jgi:hypothetical protein